jgi:hypothetical protein
MEKNTQFACVNCNGTILKLYTIYIYIYIYILVGMWLVAHFSVLSGSLFVYVEPAGFCVLVNLYLEAP